VVGVGHRVRGGKEAVRVDDVVGYAGGDAPDVLSDVLTAAHQRGARQQYGERQSVVDAESRVVDDHQLDPTQSGLADDRAEHADHGEIGLRTEYVSLPSTDNVKNVKRSTTRPHATAREKKINAQNTRRHCRARNTTVYDWRARTDDAHRTGFNGGGGGGDVPTALSHGADGGGCGCGGDAFFVRQRTRLVRSRGARGPVVSGGGSVGGGVGGEGGGGYWWLRLPTFGGLIYYFNIPKIRLILLSKREKRLLKCYL